MRVVINQKHLGLNRMLVREANRSAKNFNNKSYSRIENIEAILLKRDIPVQAKKNILIKKLHGFVISTFSIDKGKFNKKSFALLRKRLHQIRKIINKLRSINYYLETSFLEDLKLTKANAQDKLRSRSRHSTLAMDELEVLEYTSYKMIEEAVMLDKRVLKGYKHREIKLIRKEKVGIIHLGNVLGKESELLEHLEAKLPPPKSATKDLINNPLFTHWVARIFALLAYLEFFYGKEQIIFKQLKKDKYARSRINKKIIHIARENSELIRIMEEKIASIGNLRVDDGLKQKLHRFTTAINL
ncbi:hypothetical protein HYY70_03520 [Candidatus Woesearchaeota archaeon]|nr:hypothetical protein [Candidatus Woesearchaeota archaeon]